jgi:O-antigen/teichoic acid export membrane protein
VSLRLSQPGPTSTPPHHPPRSALVRSTLGGLTSQYTAMLVNGVVQLGALAFLARLLTPADYGLMGVAGVFASLGGFLGQFGIGVALVQRQELTERDIRAGFTLAMGLALALALLTIVAAPLIAALFRSPELTPVVRVLSLTFPLANLGYVAESLLDRALAWRRNMWVNLISTVVGNAAVACALAVLGFGVWALAISQLTAALLRSVLLLAWQPHPKRPLFDGHEMGALLRFGRGLTTARLFNYGASQADYLIVGRVLGVTPLGYYTRAFRLMLIPINYFAAVVTRVLFPTMARLQQEPAKLAAAYLTGGAILGAVSGPLSALLVVLAPELVAVVLGPRWAPAVAPFQVLAAGLWLRSGFTMAYCLDGALGDMGKRIIRDGVYAAAVAIGCLAAVRWGLTAVAWAVFLAVAIHYVLGAAMSRRLLVFTWGEYWHSQWPGLFLAAVTAAVAVPLRLALRARGMPDVIVLVGTAAMAGAAGAALALLVPATLGRYGRTALRLAGEASAGRVPDRVAAWLRRMDQTIPTRW